jgi:hypothetical protein
LPDLTTHTHETCPSCDASMCAGLIADTIELGEYHSQPYTLEEIQDMYGDKRCYSRKIGVQIQGMYDGVCYWRYPCCGLEVEVVPGALSKTGGYHG